MNGRVVLVALLGAVALGLILGALSDVLWASPGPPASPPAEGGPGPADISALIEEARRITGEAAG